MQTAARKVLDENNMLRSMLNWKGVSNDEINNFISNLAMDPLDPQDTPLPASSVALAGLLKLDTTVNSTHIGQLKCVSAPLNGSMATPELVCGECNTEAALFVSPFSSTPCSEGQPFSVTSTPFGHSFGPQFEGSLVKQEATHWAIERF